MRKYLLLGALLISASVFSQTITIYYVNHLHQGSGTSWDNAFHTLQEALDVAEAPAEIWVAAGTYHPESTYGLDEGNGDVGLRHFRMKNGVAIYGGFTGDETSRDERDWHLNKTILSGIISGEGTCYHLFYHVGLGLDESAVLDGFTITGGRANHSEDTELHYAGGGMLNASEIVTGSEVNPLDDIDFVEETASSPTIINCTFTGNSATFGGGMANLTGSSPRIIHCNFQENDAVDGGGIFNALDSEPYIANSFFDNNNSFNSGGKAFPGAVGYGSGSKGAYGNSSEPVILIVDTLDPGNFSTGENRGTFMWAVTRNYPRIVLFEVSGIIDYSETIWRVQIEEPYLTVYGQTAPGKGITVKGATLWIQSNDMVFQHLRFKVGDHDHGRDPDAIDALSFYHGADNIMFDHCSFSWSVDELVGSKASNQNITFSNCMFAEPLDRSWHIKEGTGMAERHPYGCLMYAGNLTFYRNLFAYSYGRNPLIRQAGNHIINNYNYCTLWAGPMVENIGYDIHAAIIGNHIDNIPFDGNMRTVGNYHTYIVNNLTAGSRVYVEDNICAEKTNNPGLDEWDYVVGKNRGTEAATPTIDIDQFDILAGKRVKAHVLDNAGAIPWNRDISDQNVIDKIRADAQGELRHSAYDYPATARNLQGTATSGNLLYGYNWSDNPQDLEISYNETLESVIIGPVTITLDQNCESILDVVTYLNSVLPDGLTAVRNGPAGFPGNMVFIHTTHVGDGAFIEIHDEGTAHATMGIPATQFHGHSYTGYDEESDYMLLELPDNPHLDADENGFTKLQEWIHYTHEQRGRRGGGMHNYKSSPVAINSVFAGNYAFDAGGGMFNHDSNPEIINCTFSKNASFNGGGGIGNSSSSPAVINTIIYDNFSNITGFEEIGTTDGFSGFSYSNIKGSGGSSGWIGELGADQGNNIDEEPDFAATGDHLYALTESSPCVEAGSNTPFDEHSLARDIDTDIRGEGWPRMMIADGSMQGGVADMGAYEFNSDTVTVGIPEEGAVPVYPGVKIYPNPANSFVFVQIASLADHSSYNYRLVDLTGRFIETGIIIKNTTRINLDELTSGIYILFILQNGLTLESGKIYIQ